MKSNIPTEISHLLYFHNRSPSSKRLTSALAEEYMSIEGLALDSEIDLIALIGKFTGCVAVAPIKRSQISLKSINKRN